MRLAREAKKPALWGPSDPGAQVDMALKRRDALPELRPGPSLVVGKGEGLRPRAHSGDHRGTGVGLSVP